MAKIFISYRRTDSAAISGRIYDRLIARFKRKNLFKDVDNIPAGVDFGGYIQQSLRECAVMLVIIGPHWVDTPTPSGGQRLDDPHDWVRVEIETGLSLGLTVIPLLVEGAPIPAADQLPESLREIARLNALPVRNDPDFARDMERVINAIESAFVAQRAQRPPSLPGVFHRRASSRPVAEPSVVPEQPAPTLNPILEPTLPGPPVTASTISSNTSFPGEASEASTGRASRWRLPLAVMTVILVVASIAVLLSRGVIPVGAGGRTNLGPTATATNLPQPTATPKPVLTHPLVVALPGPGICAQKSNMEQVESGWETYPDGDIVDCSNGRATRIYPGSCDCSGVTTDGLNFMLENTGIYLSPPYTISVAVSGLTAITEAHLDLFLTTDGGHPYDFGLYNNLQITGNAYYQIGGRIICPSQTCLGYFDVNKTNTLAFHFTEDGVTALLNGLTVASQSLTSPQTIELVELFVSIIPRGQGYTGNPYHADFSNFTITPY